MAATRARLLPEERRALILDSALDAFSRLGYHAASISEIARGAGTTKAVIYDHVASKRELYDAVVQRELQMLLTHTARASAASDGADRLRAVIERFFEHIEARPQARRVMFETVDAADGTASDGRANQRIATTVIAAWLGEEPTLLPGAADRDESLEMVAQMLKSSLNGLADWWYDHPSAPRSEVVDLAEAFLRGALGTFAD